MKMTAADVLAHQRKHGFAPATLRAPCAAAGGAVVGAQAYEASPDGPLPHAKPQRHEAPALEGAGEGKETLLGRVRVRITGYRVRPNDPDNFAGSCKDSIDFLRHCGLIEGDEAWRITLETAQVKVATFAEEKTVIEIEDTAP